MATDSTSLRSNTSSKPRTPGIDPAGRKVGFARPTLIIPPPNLQQRPYYANIGGLTPHSPGSLHTPGGTLKPGMYGRKASKFMNRQFIGIKDFTMSTAKSGLGIGEKCSYWCYGKIRQLSRKWFTHCFLSIVLVIYTVGGALIFAYIEGQNEELIKEGDLRSDRYKLIRALRELSINLPNKTSDGEWEGAAVRLMREYEDAIIHYYQQYDLIMSNRDKKIWTLWNAIVYSVTVYTTLGYGHIFPETQTGRALTIIYAIIGIPLFLIALTDFGKLFTRAIKFLWSFVRRLYYTGSCRKARKSAKESDIFRGAQMMYEIATFRRASNMSVGVDDSHMPKTAPSQTSAATQLYSEETPTTPDLSTFEIDDEFNLPISVALFILVAYMFIGALIYCAWEKWAFFESFYFVFISLSTVGFGDFIPRHPICVIVSIVYLVFGLALMSMCINVVQVKLSDTFQQASLKLSSSMGFELSEEESSHSLDILTLEKDESVQNILEQEEEEEAKMGIRRGKSMKLPLRRFANEGDENPIDVPVSVPIDNTNKLGNLPTQISIQEVNEIKTGEGDVIKDQPKNNSQ